MAFRLVATADVHASALNTYIFTWPVTVTKVIESVIKMVEVLAEHAFSGAYSRVQQICELRYAARPYLGSCAEQNPALWSMQ